MVFIKALYTPYKMKLRGSLRRQRGEVRVGSPSSVGQLESKSGPRGSGPRNMIRKAGSNSA